MLATYNAKYKTYLLHVKTLKKITQFTVNGNLNLCFSESQTLLFVM